MLVQMQDFAALEAAWSRVDAEGRSTAARELAGALVERADGGATECRIYDEVVCWLVRRSDGSVRTAVAERVCAAERGPDLTVAELAHDPDPAVAGPILRRSPLLADADLAAVARVRGEAHLCAIAERPHLAEPVTDVVVGRGTWPVLRAVARNATARLSSSSLDRLAFAAEGDGRITVDLLRRGNMPIAVTQALVGHYDALSRSGRLDQRGEDSGLMLDACPRRIASSPPRTAPSAAELRAAEAQAAAMSRHLTLGADDVVWCLDHERWTEALAVVARLAAQPPGRVADAFSRRNPGAMLALMVLADAPWSVAERVLLCWEASTEDELARQEATFRALTRAAAERILKAAGFAEPLAVGA